jgi:uncharacterized iron-regulated protein
VKRRALLRWPTALLGRASLGVGLGGLGSCAQFGVGHPLSADRLIDLRSGREIGMEELLQQMRASRFVLLGERHDNPHHHARRAELLRRLAGSGAVVVAEHLARGRHVATVGDLLAALKAGGFDPAGWQWPLHQPLFEAVREAGLPLLGGNLPPEAARRIARDGEAALTGALADIASLLQAAPLPAEVQARLDADLLAGHCGHLSAARLPATRLAQRARDAAMALALQRSGSGYRPAVLLAGNGHVRSDHGVPQLLAVLDPAAPVVNVVFGETGGEPGETQATHLWITQAAQREDPCQAFNRMRRPTVPERPQAR